MYCVVELDQNKIYFEKGEYHCVENQEYIILYDGNPVSNFEDYIDESISIKIWSKMFIGPFVLIIFQKVSGKMIIAQHLFGNGADLYWCKKDNRYYITSSLKVLKKLAKIPFELNVQMLPYYFYNGFLPGAHTLICGVQKLEAGINLFVDKYGVHKELILSLIFEGVNLNNPIVEYQDALSNGIFETTSDLSDAVSLALSGGYDSNCILFSIKNRWPGRRINAFSIGGINGVDETSIAADIAKQYDNVSFKSSFVNPETLNHLDEIVEVLEGGVYERGIFLQYELAKLLKTNGIKHFICGECVDQVFHENTYNPIPENTFLYGYQDTPYQMAAYVVLKKNRKIMDAYGINVRYPFLTHKMISVGYMTRNMNGTTKEFHKAQCKKMLPNTILKLISKQGGSTDLSALFEPGFDCSKELEKCRYYSTDFRLTEKYCHEESVRDYYLSLLYLESFERQFCN